MSATAKPSSARAAASSRQLFSLCWLLGLFFSPDLGAAFHPETLARLDGAITNAIARKELPGAVLWLEHNGESYHRAYGNRALKPSVEPMTEDTIFDVASLTKVLATTPAIMRLIERGEVKLDEPASRYLPELSGEQTAATTVRHLLTHTSGLVSGIGGTPFKDYQGAIYQATEEHPQMAPGTEFHYCDVNFILLGEIVRRVAKQPLNEFVAETFYRPLGMKDTGYLPSSSLVARIAPTERSGLGWLRGRVHDPTTRRMGGVAGQAGVFSTAADLARFARMLLREGELDGVRVLRPETVRLMTSVQTPERVLARRGLGWDIDSGYSRPRGLVFPLGSYGHTGFTGAMLWIDPFSKTFVVFVSNRVHPSGGPNLLELYSIVGTLAAQAVEGFDFKQVPDALPFRTNFIQWGAVTNYLGR